MSKYFSLIASFFCFIHIAFSQTATIKGIVIDEKNEGLFGVNVATERLEGAATDFDGKYEFTVKPGTFKITYSLMGYGSKEEIVTVSDGEVKTVNMSLKMTERVLGPIVVGSTKSGKLLEKETGTVDVIPVTLLENNNITNSADAVEKVPGVVIVDGQASIRGGSGYAYGVGSRVILVVDDIPLLTPERSEVLWDFVPIEIIDQIEVVKGASSVQYGSSALNGIVHARTKWPKEEKETSAVAYSTIYNDPENEKIPWWKGNTGSNSFQDAPHELGMYISHGRKINDNTRLVVGGLAASDQTHLKDEFNHRLRGDVNVRYISPKREGLTMGLNTTAMFRNRSIFFLWDGLDEGMFVPLGGSASYRARYVYVTLDPSINYYFGEGKKECHKIYKPYLF